MKGSGAFTALLLNLLCGIAAFGWTHLMHRGLFSVAGDFNVQQIPFAMHTMDALKSGNIGWDWSLDLGSGLIGGMAFYVLGNPSFYLAALFPSDLFMYLAGWIYVLKYAAAGVTSYLWLRRLVKNDAHAVTASVMYAFSGFMGENLLFYHFHDVTALFPLMMIGTDRIMEGKRRGFLIAATALNALVNYFFLPGEILFLAAYFLIRYAAGEDMSRMKKLPGILLEGIQGGLISCALLLPAALFTAQNPRVKFDYTGSNSLVFTAERYLYILKALIFPGEVMSDQSAVIQHNFSSCAAYIPMAGLILVIAFVMLHKKHWLSRMLLFSLVMAVIPVCNAAFSMFAGLYHRWYYMPVLLFAAAGAMMTDRMEREERHFESPDEAENAVTKAAVIWGLVTVFFICFLLFVPWSESEPSRIFHPDVFAAWCCVSALGTILTWIILSRRGRLRFILFRAGVALFAVGTTIAVLALYQDANGENAEQLRDRIVTSRAFPDPAPSYRYANRDNPETLTHGYPSSANFCSTVSGSIFRFYESLGLKRDVKSPDPPAGLEHLISAKYYFSTEEDEEHGMLLRTVKGDTRTYYLYQNAQIPPIGFTYDTYMTASEFAGTEERTRAVLMLKTLVIPDEKEAEVSEVLRHFDKKRDGAFGTDQIAEISAEHLAEAARDAEADTWSYEASLSAEQDTYAFFSIPDDPGWSAEVNGTPAEIIDINGFMAVRIGAGDNRIRFSYRVPGLCEGIALSLLGAAASLLLVLADGRRRGRRGARKGKRAEKM